MGRLHKGREGRGLWGGWGWLPYCTAVKSHSYNKARGGIMVGRLGWQCTLHTAHSMLYNAHLMLYTAHYMLHTAHSILQHCTPYAAHCTLYIALCTLYAAHCTLYAVPCTFRLNTSHSILHTALSMLHTSHCTMRTLTMAWTLERDVHIDASRKDKPRERDEEGENCTGTFVHYGYV